MRDPKRGSRLEWSWLGSSRSYLGGFQGHTPDHRKDLKSRAPNLGPYTTKGYLFKGTLLGDLYFRSFRWPGTGRLRAFGYSCGACGSGPLEYHS